MPTRCAAAPSSVGAGILLQSTSSRFLWFIASPSASTPHGGEAPLRRPEPWSRSPRRSRRAQERAPRDEETTLSPRPQQAALLPAPVALFLALALVVQLLALVHRQQQLRAAALGAVTL